MHCDPWNNIPAAEMSPRIQNGVLMWYEGDTFTADITLYLTDQDGEVVTIPDDATVVVRFVDASNDTAKEFSFTNIEENTVSLEFDATCSALFPRGEYRYDLYFTADNRTTLISKNRVVVE